MNHYPTIFDIFSLKRFLSHSIPNELIEIILDLAEYWPHSSCSSTSAVKAQGKIQENILRTDWREHRGPEATTPLSFIDSRENGFVLRSPPLGTFPTKSVQLQASLVPRTRNPVRMILFEIRFYRLFAMNPKCRRRQILRQSRTRLEIGIKKPMPPTESPLRAVPEPAARPAAQILQGRPQLQQVCGSIYESWRLKRSFCDPAHAKIDLYMDHKVLADGMVGQKTVFWRCDDDDVTGTNFLDDGWDLSRECLPHLSEAETAHVNDLVHSLAKEERMEKAAFVRQLEVGDSLGVWVRVRDGPSVSMIERVRMHVFWAAS